MNEPLAQIEKDAEEYAKTAPGLYAMADHKAGAISQNNKPIESIERFMDGLSGLAHWWDDEPEAATLTKGADKAFELIREHLETLKITDK